MPSMPGSLEEALSCLEEDHQFLLKGDVFTGDGWRLLSNTSAKRKRRLCGCVLIRTSFRCITTSKVTRVGFRRSGLHVRMESGLFNRDSEIDVQHKVLFSLADELLNDRQWRRAGE